MKIVDNSSSEYSFTVPFYLYSSYNSNEWLSAGLAVYTPFQANTKWEKDWQGSHLVNQFELSTIFIQPLLALKIADNFSIGGGPILATGNVSLNRNFDRSLTDENNLRSNITLEDSKLNNWGWSACFLFSLSKDFRIGFNYRSKIKLDAQNAEATFSNFPINSNLSNTVLPFQSSLVLPAELKIGFTYQITENFLFAFDYNRLFWESLEVVDINFNSTTVDDISIPFNFKNANAYRFGMQYKAMRNLIIRGGFYKEISPNTNGSISPLYPNNNGQGFTSGLSVRLNRHFWIDTSFVYVRERELNASYDFYTESGETIPFEGNYLSNLFAFGVGLSFKL
jgi:long-chain fatty acid transport protein